MVGCSVAGCCVARCSVEKCSRATGCSVVGYTVVGVVWQGVQRLVSGSSFKMVSSKAWVGNAGSSDLLQVASLEVILLLLATMEWALLFWDGYLTTVCCTSTAGFNFFLIMTCHLIFLILFSHVALLEMKS